MRARWRTAAVGPPETIRETSLALEKVCDALRLKLVDDAATRLVATKIIELNAGYVT
jgi:hypothetical protein